MCLASSISFFCNDPIRLLAHHSKQKWNLWRTTTFAKAHGIKVRCYGENMLEEHIGEAPVLVHSRQNWSLIFQVHLTWSFTTLSVAVFWAVFLLLQFCSLLNKAFFFFFLASTLTPLQKLAHPPKNSQCWVFYYGCSCWWWWWWWTIVIPFCIDKIS
jgi:hypothetical protein